MSKIQQLTTCWGAKLKSRLSPSSLRSNHKAKTQIQRQVDGLEFFATLPTTGYDDGTERPEKIIWKTFQFKPEFRDLKANGFVSGVVDKEPVGHGTQTTMKSLVGQVAGGRCFLCCQSMGVVAFLVSAHSVRGGS